LPTIWAAIISETKKKRGVVGLERKIIIREDFIFIFIFKFIMIMKP
jgi:hypothetical protein